MNLYFDCLQEVLKNEEVDIVANVDMRTLSSAKIGGVADVVLFPRTLYSFEKTLSVLINNSMPYAILGGGTNVLLPDGHFNGVLVRTTKLQGKSMAENGATFECGCGINSCLSFVRGYGSGGFEELASIPGTIGGAVYGNSGAYGRQICDFVTEGLFFDPITLGRVSLKREDMSFDYRSSFMNKSNLVLLSVKLSSSSVVRSDSIAKVKLFAAKRADSQPLSYPSLGSVFKRADGVGAGWYIERAGLKGMRIGDAEVSTKHAGFIINKGSASAKDFRQLISLIQARVFDKFGTLLEPEILFLEDILRG